MHKEIYALALTNCGTAFLFIVFRNAANLQIISTNVYLSISSK